MIGQTFDLVRASPRRHLVQALGIEPFKPRDDAGMQGPPPLLQQAAIGHLLGEGVLEGIGEAGSSRLIEELGGLEMAEVREESLPQRGRSRPGGAAQRPASR